MNWYRLTHNERAMTGFTDVLVVDYTELTTAGTTQTISHTLPSGVFLDATVIMRADKLFANPNGASALTAEVGHNGLTFSGGTLSADADGIVDAGAIEDGVSAGVIYGTRNASSMFGVYDGFFLTNTGATHSRIDVLFTSSGGNLGDATNTLCTSGQLSVWLKVLRDTDFELRQA